MEKNGLASTVLVCTRKLGSTQRDWFAILEILTHARSTPLYVSVSE